VVIGGNIDGPFAVFGFFDFGFQFARRNRNVTVFLDKDRFDEIKDKAQNFLGTVSDNQDTSRAENHKRDFRVFSVFVEFAHFHSSVAGIDSSRLNGMVESEFVVEIELTFDAGVNTRVIGRFNAVFFAAQELKQYIAIDVKPAIEIGIDEHIVVFR
jgi:hypothetical protein